MKLYHTTSKNRLESILEVGLQPRGSRGGNWFTNCQGHSEMVYLSAKPQDFYGIRACLTPNVDDHYVILEADVIEDNFYPDENFYRRGKQISISEGNREVEGLENKDWSQSLLKIGLIAFKGTVRPENIKVNDIIPVNQSGFYRKDLFDEDNIWIRLVKFDLLLQKANKLEISTYTALHTFWTSAKFADQITEADAKQYILRGRL